MEELSFWNEEADRLNAMAAKARENGSVISTQATENVVSPYAEQLGAEAGEGTPEWVDPVLWNQAKARTGTPAETAEEYIRLGGVVR